MTATTADGTSQADRLRPELDPAYAAIDERSAADLLAFARAYAGELVYIDETGQPQGDWQRLFPDADALLEAADYLRAPERFSPGGAAPYARPHFALLLAFVDLLGLARAQLNGLTARHLAYFYRDVLRMVRKPPVPDRVHVLMPPDARTTRLHLPAGTALRAGKDSAGADLVYRTATDLTASPVAVAELRSVRADIRAVDVRQAARRHLVRGTRQEAFVAMLRIALGFPQPGDALPVPVMPGLPPTPATGQPPAEVDFNTLVQAHQAVAFVETGLFMPLFDEFRRLLQLRRSRQANDAADWARINGLLDQAGRQRDPAFRLQPQRVDDFLGNLRSALGLSVAAYAKLYDRLPEVASAEDAYALLGNRPDVQAFVQRELYLSLDDFRTMMQAKGRIDGEWAEIADLLQAAGARRQPGLMLSAALRQAHDFDALLAAALGPLAWPVPGALAGLYDAFIAIERYFGMSAERFHFMMAVGRRSLALPDNVAYASRADEADWAQVYAFCNDAHAEWVYRRRGEALRRLAAPGIAAGNPAAALAAMLLPVLGEATELDAGLQRLAGLGVGAADQQWLAGLRSAAAPSAAEWDRAATVLEIAQRNRQGFTAPVPVQRLWHHLYPAADARQVRASGPATDAAAPRWKPFGSLAAASQPVPPAAEALGWALASPLLALAEGHRGVVLTLGLDSDPALFDAEALRRLLAPPDGAGTTATVNPFHLQLSGPEGWVEPASVQLGWVQPGLGGYPAVPGQDTATLRALIFRITLTDQQPAVVPPTPALHGLVADAPVLRLMLRPVWQAQAGCHTSAYQALSRLRLRRLRLAVNVAGLASLALRNDQAVLDPKKPFEPFGSSPASGARLSIGHPELVGKALDAISFRGSWMGTPASLTTHYTNYDGALTSASFTARIGLRDGLVFSAATTPLPLFDPASPANPVQLSPTLPADPGRPAVERNAGSDVGDWHRSWVWELAGDFQHAVYPSLALKRSLDLAVAMTQTPKPDPKAFLVNPPYTPKLKSLVVDYSASVEQPALVPADSARSGLALHHVHPFGHQPLLAASAADVGAGVPLLPVYDAEGELYIGLARVQAPQRLSLLVQVAEGSANPDVAPEPVQWSVLSGDTWRSLQDGEFEGSLLSDGTRGLINAGIVELQLPPVQPSTLLPRAGTGADPLVWLRLRMPRATDGVCDLVALHPHAVLAVFDDQGNAADHLARPLPPDQIDGPLRPVAGLGTVRQPYSSFGGRPAEQDDRFHVRVSERLRHRQRALTPWDYERLVLERFPQLYKVKCLRADDGDGASEPGQVDLVVVPDITDRFPFNPFAPKAPADLIRDIAGFLADKTPDSAQVQVRNAHFVALKVRCGVRFRPGTDEGYGRQRLGDDLNRFLSPWAYEEGADLVIGGSIYANSIINFLEQRDYVDFIAGLRLFTGEDGRFTLVPDGPGYCASVQRADAVLVAADTHEFDVIAATDYRVQGFGGIGYMRIELDFQVA